MNQPMHHDQFITLTREGMYEELKRISPAHAKGKSRATKEALKEAYRAALIELFPTPGLKSAEQLVEEAAAGKLVEASGEVAPMMFPPSTKPYNGEDMVGDDSPLMPVDYAALETRALAASEQPHIHGPNFGHLPEVAGVAEMSRVNPEMPEMPFREMVDGAVMQIPPDDAAVREFVFKDTGKQDRPLSPRQERIWSRFITAFKAFQGNPADSGARRAAKAAAYDLKVEGVLVNPQFIKTLSDGAAHVREIRKMHKLGVDVKAAAKEQRA